MHLKSTLLKRQWRFLLQLLPRNFESKYSQVCYFVHVELHQVRILVFDIKRVQCLTPAPSHHEICHQLCMLYNNNVHVQIVIVLMAEEHNNSCYSIINFLHRKFIHSSFLFSFREALNRKYKFNWEDVHGFLINHLLSDQLITKMALKLTTA